SERTARALAGELDTRDSSFWQDEYERNPTWSNAVTALGDRLMTGIANSAKKSQELKLKAFVYLALRQTQSLPRISAEDSAGTGILTHPIADELPAVPGYEGESEDRWSRSWSTGGSQIHERGWRDSS